MTIGAFSLDFRVVQKHFLEKLEAASGKPVILQSDSTFHGHATIKLAAKDQPAHLLLYKPEQESVLPYLVAYQCEFSLRTIEANPSAQFDLVAKGNMLPDVLELMQRHHRGRTTSQLPPCLSWRSVLVTDLVSSCDLCRSRCESTSRFMTLIRN